MPHFAHGKHVGWLGLRYGTALLSRLNLENSASHGFAAGPLTLPKGMVVCTLCWPESGSRQVDFASLHLDFLRQRARCATSGGNRRSDGPWQAAVVGPSAREHFRAMHVASERPTGQALPDVSDWARMGTSENGIVS